MTQFFYFLGYRTPLRDDVGNLKHNVSVTFAASSAYIFGFLIKLLYRKYLAFFALLIVFTIILPNKFGLFPWIKSLIYHRNVWKTL